MTNGLAEQLLQEVKEMRVELREVRAALDVDNEVDSLDSYEDPKAILEAFEAATKEHGDPRNV